MYHVIVRLFDGLDGHPCKRLLNAPTCRTAVHGGTEKLEVTISCCPLTTKLGTNFNSVSVRATNASIIGE